MPVKKVDLSVIVLNYNTRELVKTCLLSLKKQKGIDFETIVVDNASSDDSREMIIKEFPEVNLVDSKVNLGFAGGNNLGIKEARGKYLLFLNSDTEVLPGGLKEAVNFMDSDRKIGAMTPRILLASGGIDPDCHRGFPTPWASISYFLGLEKLFPQSTLFGQYHKFYLGLDKTHEIDAGVGAFMIVSREIIDKVGVWDDSYFFYGEDLDFFYRIRQAGYKVFYYANPLVIHHKGGSSGLRKESRKVAKAGREVRIKTAKATIKAMEIFYKKFYSKAYPSWLTSFVLLGIRIKGMFRLMKQYLN